MILATGLSGTIGRHLGPNINTFSPDLTKDFDSAQTGLLENVQTMIHLAGKVGVMACESNPKESYELNVLGTLRLGKAILEGSTGRLIFISSGHVYEGSPFSLKEDAPLNPQSTYAQHKLLAEDGLLSLFNNQPHRLTILRVFSVLDWNTARGSLGANITRILHAREKIVINNSRDIRDFLTPVTIAQAISRVATENRISGILNLCSSNALTIEKACARMAHLAKFPLDYFDFRRENSSLPHLIGNNSLIKSFLPDINLEWNVKDPSLPR